MPPQPIAAMQEQRATVKLLQIVCIHSNSDGVITSSSVSVPELSVCSGSELH